MIEVQNTKMIIALRPQLKDNGAFANNTYWDRAGWSHERVLIIVGDTDIAMTAALKVEECDTTGGSYTDVSGATLADAISDTEDNSLFAIDIDLTKSHKRYGRVNAPTAGDGTVGTNLAILVILSRPDVGPKDAAGQGLTEHIKA